MIQEIRFIFNFSRCSLLSPEYCASVLNVNQKNQFYLTNNEASCHDIYVNDTHTEKLFFAKSNTKN